MWIEKKKKRSHYNSRVSLHEAPTKKKAGVCWQVLQLYQDHEHLAKSTEQLSTTLSSFKSSKSASLRAFASQMTLDIQGSSSDEFLSQQQQPQHSTSSHTLQLGGGGGDRGGGGGTGGQHPRPFSTLSLHR